MFIISLTIRRYLKQVHASTVNEAIIEWFNESKLKIFFVGQIIIPG